MFRKIFVVFGVSSAGTIPNERDVAVSEPGLDDSTKVGYTTDIPNWAIDVTSEATDGIFEMILVSSAPSRKLNEFTESALLNEASGDMFELTLATAAPSGNISELTDAAISNEAIEDMFELTTAAPSQNISEFTEAALSTTDSYVVYAHMFTTDSYIYAGESVEFALSPCSRTCGTGYHVRSVVCNNGETCPGMNESDTIECNTTPCHIREEACESYNGNGKTTYEGSEVVFGCHQGYCWSYCGFSWQSGEWCWTEGARGGPYHEKYIKCSTDVDCCSHYGYEKCGGTCSIF